MSRLPGPFSPPPLTVKQRVKRDTLAEAAEKRYVRGRDNGCVAPRAVVYHRGHVILSLCDGPLDVDHVRASGGLGMKSPTHRTNMVTLCRHHHKAKTEWGKTWRPLLIEYLDRVEGPAT
jgi:5-methylcytosine-specific restriction endonuclease McrA